MNFHKPHVFFTYSEIDLSIYISLAPLHTITVVAVSIHRGWVLTGKSLIPGDVLLSFGSWSRSSVLTLRPTQNSWGLRWLPVPCTTMGLYSPVAGRQRRACLRLMSLHVLSNYFNYLIMYQIYSWKHREIGSNLRTNRSILRHLCCVYKSFRR